MQRIFRLTLLMVLTGFISVGTMLALPQVYVSGRVAPDEVRVFLKDSTYIIDRDFVIGGTLIIEPGTEVLFYPNGRLIDSVGGRILADGLARVTYTPGSTNPLSSSNSYYGYADPEYFLGSGVVTVNTPQEMTVNMEKENFSYNVLLNTRTKEIVNMEDGSSYESYSKFDNSTATGKEVVGSDMYIVSFEQALLWKAARIGEFNPPIGDTLLNINKWQRYGYKNVNVEAATITFKGQPVNNASREWGHIVILPGARAAFFRNCSFENFRKDVTVDRAPFYNTSVEGSQFAAINNRMNEMTNGVGGALTTFASRTWLLECTFKDNMARLRGGALAMLQSPEGFAKTSKSLGNYYIDKNPQVYDNDYSSSDLIKTKTGSNSALYPLINERSNLLKIDAIDESIMEPLTDAERQYYDDARLAVYLGRVRNLTFENNYVQIADVKSIGGVVKDDIENPAPYPVKYGNGAYGGAVYMSGEGYVRNSKIELGFGINNQIRVGNAYINLYNSSSNDAFDTFGAEGNFAANYQDAAGSEGSRGGAIYLGKNTGLILAGELTSNYTTAEYKNKGTLAASYSMGGAIYVNNSNSKITFRGSPAKVTANPTVISLNTSGAGGAVYVDGNSTYPGSPIIGGTDVLLKTRDLGFGIKFVENSASAFGGAIFTKRQMTIHGAGGVADNAVIGYNGNYPVKFIANTAGYAGGAIEAFIPFAAPGEYIPAERKTMRIVRALFEDNYVGMASYETDADDAVNVRGGGAIYAVNADLNVIKGTHFINNTAYNGNGGAIALLCPSKLAKRAYVSDLDNVQMYNGVVSGYSSSNEVFTYGVENIPADVAMLTMFINNKAVADADIMAISNGSGATQIEKGTSKTTKKLLGSYWFDANEGFVVGYGGTIIKITNGGKDWSYIKSGTNYRLEDVFFVSKSVGFVTGDHGVILRTEDGGDNWTTVSTGMVNTIYDIEFVGTQNGFAVAENGVILTTVDAGKTWTSKKITDVNIYGVTAVSKTTAFVVGEEGYILKTLDGGMTWDYCRMTGLKKDLTSVYFTSANNGVAVGEDGTIIQTTDGGDSWNLVQSDKNNLNDVYFISNTIGFAAGIYGDLYKTNDGGANWTKLNMGNTWNIYGVYFSTLNNGYIVGDYGMLKTTNDGGSSWTEMAPEDKSFIDVVRTNPDVFIPENGVGLGGAIYILDSLNWNGVGRVDTTDMFLFNRVRIMNNEAYSGSAVYSDNYNLKLIFNRSLITKNTVISEVGKTQNVITGPFVKPDANVASSDLVGATLYGEIQGPLPAITFSEAANSIYCNDARFEIRLPDAPNTKGVLAGSTGIGFGGTDTLRGNYWGETQANVTMDIVEWGRADETSKMETFFSSCEGCDAIKESWLPFVYGTTADLREQGPFESISIYNYTPVPLRNDANDVTLPGTMSIPESVLFSGKVYDMYDKGTDIKTADYSKRRMSPIEDFAVGIPPKINYFTTDDGDMPSEGHYIKKWVRDPFVAEMKDNNGDLVYPAIAQLQREYFAPDSTGVDHHPIGYPLYLEASIDYNSGDANKLNHDTLMTNASVFFVVNETNNDFIRVVLKQVDEKAPYTEVFRATVELVPDSSQLSGYNNQNRYINRRSAEGLKTLGNGAEFLRKLRRDAYNEDYSALQGRKYHADVNKLGENSSIPNMLVDKLFNNRPSMPASNQDGNFSMATFFAGERYQALPVKIGDTIRVISRTELWRTANVDDIDGVMKGGLKFVVSESALPPVFTGDVKKLQNNVYTKRVPTQYPWKGDAYDIITVDMFKDKVFVTENRSYPGSDGEYENSDIGGRDSILTVTAIDTVKFYDPQSIWNTSDYAELMYDWSVDKNSAVAKWISVNRYSADQSKDRANGYMEFQGQPINPFVVPGGEVVTVKASTYPPTYRLIDKLRADGVDQDKLDKFVEIYPPYFNACKYDADSTTNNARFLQQDTVDFGSKVLEEYKFKIFVVDSAPRYLEFGGTETVVKRIDADTVDYVIYKPTEYKGTYYDDYLMDDVIIASVTDKLRFQIDINTDDECEDHSPAVEAYNGTPKWDYRYGMTAYGFMNIGVYNENRDTTIIDDMKYDEDPYSSEDMIIIQTKPNWMSNEYINKYDEDATVDKYLTDFTTFGQLNIRIDRAEALTMLNPYKSANENGTGYLINDTVFTVICNDGHSGITPKQYPVVINYQPEILNASLPYAVQFNNYNHDLDVYGNQAGRRNVKVFDANFGQYHTYELIYADDPRNSIAIDPNFDEAGEWDLTSDYPKVTPNWLKINKESGVLYGTPGIDAILRADLRDTTISGNTYNYAKRFATVLVTDELGLTMVRTLEFPLFAGFKAPQLQSVLSTHCVEAGGSFIDSIIVKSKEFLRDIDEVTITIENAVTGGELKGITITPSVIKASEETEEEITIIIKGEDFNENATSDDGSKLAIRITATSITGLSSTIIYYLALSQEVDFVANVIVENSNAAFQNLQFGTAPQDATVGDGTDKITFLGWIDYMFCEFELPPTPPVDVFDARWRIPMRTGILRSIHPSVKQGEQGRSIYEARFQAGGVHGQGSELYPVKITWYPSEIPTVDDADKNPSGGKWMIKDASSNGQIFRANMSDPVNHKFAASNIQIGAGDNNDYVVTVNRSDIDGFIIEYIFDAVSVNDNNGISASAITGVQPNPINDNTSVTFTLDEYSYYHIEVIDMLGKVVKTLADDTDAPGTFQIPWDGTDSYGTRVNSGSYIIRLTTGNEVSIYPVNVIR